MSTFTPQSLLPIIQSLPKTTTMWIAYSGGLDSHVLLHALAQLRDSARMHALKAIHINHDLSPNAKTWEQHCQQVCQDLNIGYYVKALKIQASKRQSCEAQARAARYAAFAQLLQNNDYLLTAHQQDDQAETLLLQLLRGAGIAGLAAMPVKKALGSGYLLRPLLPFARAELRVYAIQQQLCWIDDESNFDTGLDRNFLRHAIMPLLKKRWPQMLTTVTRSSQHCQAAQQLLQQQAVIDWQNAQGSRTGTLSVKQLLILDKLRCDNLLRYWLQTLNLPLPNTQKLAQLRTEVLQVASDKMPLLCWKSVEIRRYRDDIFATAPLVDFDASVVVSWQALNQLYAYSENVAITIDLPDPLGQLTARLSQGAGVRLEPNARYSIRFRQGGERCQPVGRQEKHALKKLFQEWGVPPWLRSRVPLLYCNDDLACVIGYCVCAPFQVNEDEIGVSFSLFQI